MESIWIGIAIGLLLAGALAFFFRKRETGATPAALIEPQAAELPVVPAPAGLATPPAQAMPTSLATFHRIPAGDLSADRREAIATVFRNIPRPPRLLDHLLSPDFVGQASSSELADLIAAEPLIAARVLATINSPLYGLRSPVNSIDQAVTLLGLTSVRSICLQYLLIASFKADSPERQQILDATWNASAIASELTNGLAQRLGFPEPGALVSAVVLSFLGRLATAATMPRGLLARIPSAGLLARTQAEQETLGLASSEIGRLLMADWGLPANVVEDAARIDTVLSTPCHTLEPVHASRLALCYLCARLGDRLASGEWDSLRSFDPQADPAPEFFHFKAYLALPTLAPLTAHLHAPATEAALQKMLRALHDPATA